MRPIAHLFTAGLVFALLSTSAATAFPSALSTAFTYQGQLKQGGSPYSGVAEFQFRLYDAASGGNQVGPQVALTRGNAPTVSNGLFTVSLDFGGSPAFNGDARWLEIDVRTGLGPFTTLSPRRPLTATPYALHVPGIAADPNGNVGIGTTNPQALLNVNGTMQWGGTTTTYAYSGEDASGMFLEQHGGSPFQSAIRLQTSKFGDATNYAQFVIDPYFGFLFKALGDSHGYVGIGTATPNHLLEVQSTFGGAAIYANNSGDVAVQGEGLDGVFGTGVNIGVRGIANGTTGQPYGVEGICTNANGYDFFAAGAGVNYGAPSSIRWKRNVTLIDSPLEKVEAMRGVIFDWDEAHGGRHDVGFIGEEVGKVLPEVVAWEADGKFVTGMDYSKLTPLLVEAVKSLRGEKDAQFVQQSQRIDSLESENAALRARLDALETTIRTLARKEQEQ